MTKTAQPPVLAVAPCSRNFVLQHRREGGEHDREMHRQTAGHDRVDSEFLGRDRGRAHGFDAQKHVRWRHCPFQAGFDGGGRRRHDGQAIGPAVGMVEFLDRRYVVGFIDLGCEAHWVGPFAGWCGDVATKPSTMQARCHLQPDLIIDGSSTAAAFETKLMYPVVRLRPRRVGSTGGERECDKGGEKQRFHGSRSFSVWLTIRAALAISASARGQSCPIKQWLRARSASQTVAIIVQQAFRRRSVMSPT